MTTAELIAAIKKADPKGEMPVQFEAVQVLGGIVAEDRKTGDLIMMLTPIALPDAGGF